jgi:hypothetical protein
MKPLLGKQIFFPPGRSSRASRRLESVLDFVLDVVTELRPGTGGDAV